MAPDKFIGKRRGFEEFMAIQVLIRSGSKVHLEELKTKVDKENAVFVDGKRVYDSDEAEKHFV